MIFFTNKNIKNLLLYAVMLLMWQGASAQCPFAGTVYGTIAAPTTCTPAYASPTCHFTSDYASFTGLVAGSTYRFATSATSNSTTPNTDELTIYLSTNTTTGNHVAYGTGGNVTFTPAVGGTYFMIINKAGATCGTAESVCRYPSIQCTSCGPPVLSTCATNSAPAVNATGVATALTTFTWSAVTNATSYDIYYATSATGCPGTGGTYTLLGNIAGTSAAVTGLAGSTSYRWYVVPKNCAGGISTANCGDANATCFTTGLATFSTAQDGDWNDPNTWAGMVVPPTSCTAGNPIVLNHNVMVTGAGCQAANLTVAAGKTLTISGGNLTLGCPSSAGGGGNSNKLLTVNGTLTVTGGVLNVNGGISIATTTSVFNQSGGDINIDPNDGTSAGSLVSSSGCFAILSGLGTVTGGNINILDPMFTAQTITAYAGSQRVISYSSASADLNWAAAGSTHTVNIGGGDDTNPLNLGGFHIECNVSTGTLGLNNLVVGGGLYSAQRQVSTNTSSIYITKAKNITVNAGSEIFQNGAVLAITGDLVNNGIITAASVTAQRGVAFCGDAQYVSTVQLYSSSVAQSLSGTGFFRKSAGDPVPTAQTGNMVGSLSVWHTSTSPGLTLNMPLAVTGATVLGNGRVNTTATNILTLGVAAVASSLIGTTASGSGANTLSSLATVAVLSTAGTAQTAVTTTATTAAWGQRGWVTGPVRRYFNAATSNSQLGILPVGYSVEAHSALLNYTAAPTAGYIDAIYNAADPGDATIADAGASGTIRRVSPTGFWNVRPTSAGSLGSGGLPAGTGTYTMQLDATNFTDRPSGALVLVDVREIKRADGGAWLQAAGTANAPTSLDVVTRTGLNTFSDFGIGIRCSTGPVNDACSAAPSLGTTGVPNAGATAQTLSCATLTNGGATADPAANTCGAGPVVFYTFTTNATASDGAGNTNVEVNLTNVTPAVSTFNFAVYSGAGCALTQVGGCAPVTTAGGAATATISSGLLPATTYTIAVQGATASDGSSFGINLSPIGALPLALTSFSGKAMRTSNMVEWVTTNEQNTKLHIVERSADGKTAWTTVGTKDAAGNSISERIYTLEDKQPIAMGYYRLRTIDNDAKETTSKIIVVERKNDKFGISNVFPVPTEKAVTVQFETTAETEVIITLTNLTGSEVHRETMSATKGINARTLDMSYLPQGTYLLTINNGSERVIEKVVKQ